MGYFLLTLLRSLWALAQFVLGVALVLGVILALLYIIAYGLQKFGILAENPIRLMFGGIADRMKDRRPYNNTDDVDIRQYITGRVSRRDAVWLKDAYERRRFNRDIDDTGR